MIKSKEIIGRLVSQYALLGYGKDTYLDAMEEGFEPLLEDTNLSYNDKRRIWGIMIDVFNKERNGTLSDDALECLRNALQDFFDSRI